MDELTESGRINSQSDRRTQRTRRALVAAFSELVLEPAQKKIRVADIVARADVGRSTFYEHYANLDDIHRHALAAPLTVLANIVVGQPAPDYMSLEELLAHFRENQRRARETLSGTDRIQVSRVLVALVEERLADRAPDLSIPVRMAAIQLSEGPLALIEFWLRGELHATVAELADAIRRFSARFFADVGADRP
ncbi:MAG: TetR/AcrR family transcriptional regulator [Gammaproteobacteria bacterium]